MLEPDNLGADVPAPVMATPAEPHGIVVCQYNPNPHTLDDECVNVRPAEWTPGAGVELLRRERPEMVPEVTAEDEAAADRLLASLPDDHTRVRAQALADPEVREAYIEAVKRAAFERGKAEAQRDVHADVIVPCRDTREDLDGALCTGEFRYGPHDIQAKCTVCGGWRGRWAPAERSAYEEGIFDTGIAEGRRQAEAEYAHRHRIRQPHECPRCGSGDRPLHEKWGLCGYCVAEVGWDA